MRLICVGDSLTFGFGVRPLQRWTHLCARQTGWSVSNEGVNGDTTGGMLARLQRLLPELKAGGIGAEHPRVLLMGGSNDVFYSGTDTGARANMGAMIHQVIGVGVLPIVGLPLPVDDAHTPEAWSAVVDFSAAASRMKGYCTWLRRYCVAFGVPYIDFYADYVKKDGTVRSELLLDGLHPTPEGHRLMAQRVSALLLEQ